MSSSKYFKNSIYANKMHFSKLLERNSNRRNRWFRKGDFCKLKYTVTIKIFMNSHYSIRVARMKSCELWTCDLDDNGNIASWNSSIRGLCIDSDHQFGFRHRFKTIELISQVIVSERSSIVATKHLIDSNYFFYFH